MRRLFALALGAFLALTAAPAHGAFPGVNGTITFHSFQVDLNLEIFGMNPDGSGLSRLTDNGPAGPRDINPASSPDGKRIAFMSNRDFFDTDRYDVYVMNADGSGQTNLTSNIFKDSFPAWSPDGQKIAFVSDRFTGPAIWVMNADGSGPAKLTDLPGSGTDGLPNWSPDGQRIAFRSERDGNGEIHVIGVDGSGETNLTNNPAGDGDPNWSPDGQKIAFVSNRSGTAEIWVMNADGSGPTRLTSLGGTDPAFSPDGTKIVYLSSATSLFYDPEIHVMNADGSGRTRLTFNGAEDGFPDWAPASTELPRLFITDARVSEGDTATFQVTLLGSQTSPVTVNVATANDTAVAPDDYTALARTLTFTPTEHNKTITVPTVDDTLDELTERFKVVLSSPSSNAAIGDGEGIGTILDTDRDGAFSCFASALRVGSFEPLRANPTTTPCRDDDHAALRSTETSGSAKATTYGARVLTDQTPDTLVDTVPARGDRATAHTSVQETTIVIGLNVITASNLVADATAECIGGPPWLHGSGHVGSLTVNGAGVAVGDGQVDVPLLLGTLHVNHSIVAGRAVTQRALWATTSVGEAIVGEAHADYEGTAAHPSGDPCTS